MVCIVTGDDQETEHIRVGNPYVAMIRYLRTYKPNIILKGLYRYT